MKTLEEKQNCKPLLNGTSDSKQALALEKIKSKENTVNSKENTVAQTVSSDTAGEKQLSYINSYL